MMNSKKRKIKLMLRENKQLKLYDKLVKSLFVEMFGE